MGGAGAGQARRARKCEVGLRGCATAGVGWGGGRAAAAGGGGGERPAAGTGGGGGTYAETSKEIAIFGTLHLRLLLKSVSGSISELETVADTEAISDAHAAAEMGFARRGGINIFVHGVTPGGGVTRSIEEDP